MGRGTKIMGMGKILRINDWMTGPMTDNILLTRLQGEKNNAYLPGVGSRRTPTVDAMGRQRREGWLEHCPFSYDQARCIHPTSAEYYAIQAFSIASDFDPKQMPKIKKNRSWWEKFASSYNPFFRVLQITIRATAKIARNTTRFSPWNVKDWPKYASLSASQWLSRSGIPRPPLRVRWIQTCLRTIGLAPPQSNLERDCWSTNRRALGRGNTANR